MHIDCESRPGYTLARVTGSIELASGERLAQTPCLKEAAEDVVLDLSGVDFLDSSGVRVLLGIIRQFIAAKRRLVLARPSPLVFKTLQLVNFDQLVLITDSVESAIGALEN